MIFSEDDRTPSRETDHTMFGAIGDAEPDPPSGGDPQNSAALQLVGAVALAALFQLAAWYDQHLGRFLIRRLGVIAFIVWVLASFPSVRRAMGRACSRWPAGGFRRIVVTGGSSVLVLLYAAQAYHDLPTGVRQRELVNATVTDLGRSVVIGPVLDLRESAQVSLKETPPVGHSVSSPSNRGVRATRGLRQAVTPPTPESLLEIPTKPLDEEAFEVEIPPQPAAPGTFVPPTPTNLRILP
jgi:hypothetical protein